MAQVQVFLEEDSEYAKTLKTCGFRWCKKDKRFERKSKNPQEVLADLKSKLPVQLPIEVKES